MRVVESTIAAGSDGNRRSARTTGRKVLRFCLVLLALSPAIITLSLVARYGVDIPYADEWTFAPLFVKAHTHTLTFSDFFEQHNEHRYVFPKLLLIAFAYLAHGNVRVEMMFSVFSGQPDFAESLADPPAHAFRYA